MQVSSRSRAVTNHHEVSQSRCPAQVLLPGQAGRGGGHQPPGPGAVPAPPLHRRGPGRGHGSVPQSAGYSVSLALWWMVVMLARAAAGGHKLWRGGHPLVQGGRVCARAGDRSQQRRHHLTSCLPCAGGAVERVGGGGLQLWVCGGQRGGQDQHQTLPSAQGVTLTQHQLGSGPRVTHLWPGTRTRRAAWAPPARCRCVTTSPSAAPAAAPGPGAAGRPGDR